MGVFCCFLLIAIASGRVIDSQDKSDQAIEEHIEDIALHNILKNDEVDSNILEDYLKLNEERLKRLIWADFHKLGVPNDMSHRKDYIRTESSRIENLVKLDFGA